MFSFYSKIHDTPLDPPTYSITTLVFMVTLSKGLLLQSLLPDKEFTYEQCNYMEGQ